MRFMVIVKASKDSDKEGALPDPKGIADMNKFNDELLEAGVLIGYDVSDLSGYPVYRT